MKGSRYFVLVVALVSVLALSACSAAIPSAFSLVDNFVLNRHTPAVSTASAPVVQTAAVQPAALQPQVRSAAQALTSTDLQSRLEEIYAAVDPSVVKIQVIEQAPSSLGNNRNFRGLPSLPGNPNGNNQNAPSVPYAQGEGSGFVWNTQGYIVTNNHVVDGASSINVTFSDGITVPATVVGTDPESDLAVVKIDPTGLKLQPITVDDSTKLKVGQFVLAIGNPFGLEGSMTFGIVSALGRSLPATNANSSSQGPTYTIPDIIQTDAPVNPGNSGGALLDLDGNLVGVPSAIESPVQASSGVGYAIPSAIVKQVVPALIQNGQYIHPWIGISGTTLTSDMATAMNLPRTQRGALVVDVTSGSPAEKAGLQGSTQQVTLNGQDVQVGGDIITAIDGQTVNRFEDLVTYLARNGQVGQTVKLTVLRNGKEMTLPLTLAARPGTAAVTPRSNQQPRQQQQPQPTPQAQQPSTTTAYLGVSGVSLSTDLANAMGLPSDQTGVLITSVANGSPADQAGLLGSFKSATINGEQVMVGGDVIVKANGKAVTSVDDLAGIVQSMQPGDKLDLSILRNGNQMSLTATLGSRPAAVPSAPQGNQPPANPRSNQGAQPNNSGTAWLGIAGVDLTPAAASAMNLSQNQTGALIQQVVPGSPAEKAGLQAGTQTLNNGNILVGGDVITAANGKAVTSMSDLVTIVQAMQPGDTLNLTVLRNGSTMNISTTLAARPAGQ